MPGVFNDEVSAFISNKVAPLPPETELPIIMDRSLRAMVANEGNDDVQGPDESNPNRTVRLSINTQPEASGLGLSHESDRRYWESASSFTDVESRRRARRRRADSKQKSLTKQMSWRKRSNDSVSLCASFSNDLFASHCWRGSAEAQQAKRRIIAELSRPMEDGGPALAYWADFLDLQANGPVSWRKEISEGVASSAKFVAFLDEHYLMSFNCLQEVAFALEHGKLVAPLVLTQGAWDLLTQPGGAQEAWTGILQDGLGNALSPLETFAGQQLTENQEFSIAALEALFQKLSSINFCACRPLDFAARGEDIVLEQATAYVSENIAYLKEYNELYRRALQWSIKGKPARSTESLLNGADVEMWQQWCNQARRLQPPPGPLQEEFVKASVRFRSFTKKTMASAAIVVVLIILGFAAWALVMWAQADLSRLEAERQKDAALLASSRSSMYLLLRYRTPGTPEELRAIGKALEIAEAIGETAAIEPQLLDIARHLQDKPFWVLDEIQPPVGASSMTAMAWSSAGSEDDAHLVPADAMLAGGFSDGSVVVWSEAPGSGTSRRPWTHTVLQNNPHTQRINAVDWGRELGNGKARWLATAGDDGTLQVWEAQAFLKGDNTTTLNVIPRGDNLLGGGASADPLSSVTSLTWAYASGTSLTASSMLAAGHRNGSITIWSVPSMEAIWVLSQPGAPLNQHIQVSLAFSTDGSGNLAAGFADTGAIYVWTELMMVYKDASRMPNDAQAHQSSIKTTLARTQPAAPALVGTLPGIRQVLWKNSSVILTTSFEWGGLQDVRVWMLPPGFHKSLPSGLPVAPVVILKTDFEAPPTSLSWAPSDHSIDGIQLAASSEDGSILAWRLSPSLEGGPPIMLGTRSWVPAVMAFSPAGVLTSGHGSEGSDACRISSVKQWVTRPVMSSVVMENTVVPESGKADPLGAMSGCCLTWHDNGKYIAGAAADPSGNWSVTIYDANRSADLPGSSLVAVLSFPMPERVFSLAWQGAKSQGPRLLAAGGDGKIYLWSPDGIPAVPGVYGGGGHAEHRLLEVPLAAGSDPITSLSWSHATGALAYGAESGAVAVLKPSFLEGLSADAAASNGTIKFGHHNGTGVVFVADHGGWGIAVWAPDGRALAAGGRDGNVTVHIMDGGVDADAFGLASSFSLEDLSIDDWKNTPIKYLEYAKVDNGGDVSAQLVAGMADGTIAVLDTTDAVAGDALAASHARILPTWSGCSALTAASLSHAGNGRLLSAWKDSSTVRLQQALSDESTTPGSTWMLSPPSPSSRPGEDIKDVAYSPDGLYISLMHYNGRVELLVAEYEALARRLKPLVAGELSERDVLNMGLPPGIAGL